MCRTRSPGHAAPVKETTFLTKDVFNERSGNRVDAPSVLVVDDEPGLLKLFGSLVERVGYRTLRARSGKEALAILETERPDLVILDLAMPQVSGFDVLRHIRSTPHLEHIKVMILTARPNKVTEIETLGIQAWLTKPVMPHDFIDALEKVLPPR